MCVGLSPIASLWAATRASGLNPTRHHETMDPVSSVFESTRPDLLATRVQPQSQGVTGPHPTASNPGPSRGAQVGRYLIIDMLGAGAMGEVFSAYDPKLDRRVALKLVKLGSHEDQAKARDRLLREAQALAKLAHPNVVAVHDAGTHGDRVFIAMEYIEGQTLSTWMTATTDAGATAWPQAMSLMLQAGRGLAAAHAAGMVHRDFKPANVMVSDDGRVRVLDFGLARRFGENDDATHDPVEPASGSEVSLSGTSNSLRLQLTQTGMVMGTPAYMAPEQFYGGPIDARTDQFAFCVVLHRALLGVRPFEGETYDELARAVQNQELREPPRGTTVPRAVQAALRRGLSANPHHRYPTMDALLEALSRAAGKGRRRLTLAVGGVAVAAALIGVGMSQPSTASTPCKGAERKLAGIWDAPRQQAIETAFEATSLPFAADAHTEAARSIGAWTEDWIATHTEICEATRVRGDQSEALMDLRIGCIDGRLLDLAALSDALVHADTEVVQSAAMSAQQLPPPRECTVLERDDDGLVLPHDPQLASGVADARRRLAKGRVLALAGKFEPARAEAEAGLAMARKLGYRPAVAEAALLLGQTHERLMLLEPTRELFEEALLSAASSGHTRIEAEALIGMLSLLGMHTGETESALRYGRHAEAVVQRLGDPVELTSSLALYRGNARTSANHLEDGLRDLERAVALSADNPRTERTHLAALNNVAALLGRQGHYRDAAEALEAALDLATTRMGPWHPTVGSYHNNLGVTYSQLNESKLAMEHQVRAIEIYEQVLGETHPELGRGYHNLGVVFAAAGDHEAAHRNYMRAVEIKTRGLGPDHPSVAFSANNVGDALLSLHRAREALPHFENALRIWTASMGPQTPNNIVALVSLGQAHLQLDEAEQAVPYLRRALGLIDGSEVAPFDVAQARFVAAQAIVRAGGDRAEARALAVQARDQLANSEGAPAEVRAEIERWLADPR